MFQALFRFFKLQAPPSQQRLPASTFVESESPDMPPLAASVMQSPLDDTPMRVPSPPVPFTRWDELESLMEERALSSTGVSDFEKTNLISYLEAHGQTNPAFEDVQILAKANNFRYNSNRFENIGELVDHLNRIDDRRKENIIKKVKDETSEIPIVYLIVVAINSYLWNLDTGVNQIQKESTLELLLSSYKKTINQELTPEEKGYVSHLANIEDYEYPDPRDIERDDPILLIDVVLDMIIDNRQDRGSFIPKKIDAYTSYDIYASIYDQYVHKDQREQFIIKLFATSGATVDQIKSNEDTPMHRLVHKLVYRKGEELEPGIIKVLEKVLTEQNINNRRGKDGNTLLLLAIKNGAYKLAEKLLEWMADPAIQDNEGNTAAHILILLERRYTRYTDRFDIQEWSHLIDSLLKTNNSQDHERIMRLTNSDGKMLGDLVAQFVQPRVV